MGPFESPRWQLARTPCRRALADKQHANTCSEARLETEHTVDSRFCRSYTDLTCAGISWWVESPQSVSAAAVPASRDDGGAVKREGPGSRVLAIQVAFFALCLCGLLLYAPSCVAQSAGDSEENKAEVKPPLTPSPLIPDKAERTPLKVSVGDVRHDTPGLAIRPGKVLHTDVDVALVNVTVTDPYNRLVTGLEPDNFRVFEDNTEQEVVAFSSEDVPISIGVIFDLSGSMSNKFAKAREAAIQFFKTANPADEFFMVSFNERAELTSAFTNSVEDLQNRMMTTSAKDRP